MEDRTFQTRELAASGREAEYFVWFRLQDNSKLTVEMTLSGLIQLQGLVNRSVEVLRDPAPDEMNAHRGTQDAAKGTV